MSNCSINNADKFVSAIKGEKFSRKLWAATFAGEVHQQIASVVDAFIELLEQDGTSPIGSLESINYELCIGRATVTLARLYDRLEVAEKASRKQRTLEIVNRLCLSESLEIAHHASYAKRILGAY